MNRVCRAVPGVIVVWGLLAVAAGVTAGQSPPPRQQPAFRAGAHFVRVDAYPVRDGRVIGGLAAADFEIREDGRPQAIETVEFIEFPAWTPEAERRDPNSVQEGFRLAADPRYRVFVIYYDVHHIPVMAAERLRRPLTNMLDRLLGPRDMVGFLTPRQSPDALTLGQRAFGIQRQLDRILEANTVGAELHDPEEAALFVCFPWMSEDEIKALIAVRRLEKVYRDLDALVARLGALREERKNIVVLTTGLTGPPLRVPDRSAPRQPVVGTSPATGRLGIDPRTIPMSGDRRWCDDELARARQFDHGRSRRDLISAARQANVAIYTVSPVGLGGENVGERGYDLMSDHTSSLLELAEGTDAVAVVSTNDLDAGLGRVVEDVSAYYTLGYYTTNTNWNGGLRRIEVRLTSSGDRIRARREYRAPTVGEMAAVHAALEAAPSPGPDPVAAALADLARVGSRATVFVRAVPAGARLHVAVELPSGSAATWAGGATVRVDAASGTSDGQDADGQIDAGTRSALITLPAAGPGPWQVTATVSGRGGTVRERLEIASPAPGAPGQPLIFRATPSPRSPLLPAAEPVFGRTERVHLEWPVADLPARYEARLLNRQGEPLGVPVALSTRSDADGARLVADVNLAPLAPGDYVVELTLERLDERHRSLSAIRVVR